MLTPPLRSGERAPSEARALVREPHSPHSAQWTALLLGAHTAVIASFLHALTNLTRPSILWSPGYCLGRVACSGGI